jgi:hypothetical protein
MGRPANMPPNQSQQPPPLFSVLQKHVDTMLQVVCNTLQSSARNEDKKMIFNKRMSMTVTPYLDVLDRLEDEVVSISFHHHVSRLIPIGTDRVL